MISNYISYSLAILEIFLYGGANGWKSNNNMDSYTEKKIIIERFMASFKNERIFNLEKAIYGYSFVQYIFEAEDVFWEELCKNSSNTCNGTNCTMGTCVTF